MQQLMTDEEFRALSDEGQQGIRYCQAAVAVAQTDEERELWERRLEHHVASLQENEVAA